MTKTTKCRLTLTTLNCTQSVVGLSICAQNDPFPEKVSRVTKYLLAETPRELTPCSPQGKPVFSGSLFLRPSRSGSFEEELLSPKSNACQCTLQSFVHPSKQKFAQRNHFILPEYSFAVSISMRVLYSTYPSRNVAKDFLSTNICIFRYAVLYSSLPQAYRFLDFSYRSASSLTCSQSWKHPFVISEAIWGIPSRYESLANEWSGLGFDWRGWFPTVTFKIFSFLSMPLEKKGRRAECGFHSDRHLSHIMKRSDMMKSVRSNHTFH